MSATVAVGFCEPEYNPEPPFHPADDFPELRFPERATRPNAPYALLRRLLRDLAMDAGRYGSPDWNPLGDLVRPGDTVVLKPNFVLSFNAGGGDLFAVVTHPSILRALVDYVHRALGGTGRIVIADVPQMDCRWDDLMAAQRLDAIQAFYHERFGFEIEVCDLRVFAVSDPTEIAFAGNRVRRPGDPRGNVIVDLGRSSEFYGLPSHNYYGADFNRDETIRHHSGETHEYCISRTILSADVFISVPKMKVHKKVGVTLNLKGLVGINTNKNYLVHYRLGTPSEGGDEMPDGAPGVERWVGRAQRWLYDRTLARQDRLGDAAYRSALGAYRWLVKPMLEPFRSPPPPSGYVDGGNWHGNDSAWRMTADLAKILYYADAEGRLHDAVQRRIFCVVDGIIGGEGEGPLAPEPKASGCLVAGTNPLAVDLVCTRVMGFDPRRLKQFSVLGSRWNLGLRAFDEIRVLLDGREPEQPFFDAGWTDPMCAYRPHSGWTGHVEVRAGDSEPAQLTI